MAESWRSDRRKTAERGYGARWQRERKEYLRLHPLCGECEKLQIVKAATTVDHKIPHRGDQALFWDRANWQSLCTTHHNRDKQLIEHAAAIPGGDADGNPADPNHPWNAVRIPL